MTLPDWRKPCGDGRYEPHGWLTDVFGNTENCPGGSPITNADLEAIGEKVWWCEEHRTFSVPNDLNPDLIHTQCWRGQTFRPCRMVERILIPFTGVGA